ncbi:MAG: nuclear transport factor 2 family protein [Opitutaceae bacterium]
MNTKSVIKRYLEALRQGAEWRDFFRDDVTFVSHVVPVKRVEGRAAFLESTRRFYSMIAGLEVIALIVEEDRACALTRYKLQIPQGPSFGSEVAEIFKVADGKIASLDIYFDSSPFPK